MQSLSDELGVGEEQYEGRSVICSDMLVLHLPQKPWFTVFANFCGVNTAIMTDVELPIWHHLMGSGEEMGSAGSWESVQAYRWIYVQGQVKSWNKMTCLGNYMLLEHKEPVVGEGGMGTGMRLEKR